MKEAVRDEWVAAITALEPFGFDNATLIEMADGVDLRTANPFIMLWFRNIRGDFIPFAEFLVKPRPDQVLANLAPLVSAYLALLSHGYEVPLMGIPQTADHIGLWADAIAETMPDILRGDYRRVKELQAIHFRRVQESADKMRCRSNIPPDLWEKVLEFERSRLP